MGSIGYTSLNNIIKINRGDTFSFDLNIADDSSPTGRYILKENDTLYLGIMDPRQKFEDALIKKSYTKDDCDEEGNFIITIKADDTIDLCPGVYYYSVKLHRVVDNEEEYVDEVLTIINKTKFIICD